MNFDILVLIWKFWYCFHWQCIVKMRWVYNEILMAAMQSAVIATAILSVCLSATRWYPLQTNEDRIMWSLLWGSKNTLVFWYQQWLEATTPSTKNLRSKWPTPSEMRRLPPISAYNILTVSASEKSSTITNRKSATVSYTHLTLPTNREV